MSESELVVRINALADEHAAPADEAEAWLLERPELSRPALVELVETGRPDQRTRRAVRLLGRLGNPADVPLLAGLLGRPQLGLAWEGAQALVLHPSEFAAAALRRATRGKDPETIEAAASALGECRDEPGRSSLEALLVHPSEAVRHRAVYALGRLGASPSTSALRSAAERDQSADVRALIAKVLEASR